MGVSMVWVKGELLDDFTQAHRLGDGQLDRAHQPSLFDRLSWMQRVWQYTPPGQSLLIARAQSERSFAWLFLALQSPGRAVSLANWYNFSARPVLVGSPDEATGRAMLVALARRLKKGLARVTLGPLREADAESLQRACARAGWSCFRYTTSTRWSANVEGKSFADYWQERPGEVRSTFKRKAGKAGIRCEIHTDFSDAAWSAYEDVYKHSWKPEEGSFPFLKSLAQEEADAGCLRLGIAWSEDVPVAAQLWTVENGAALIHKLAYREDAKAHSPGTILSEALFRHVIDVDHVSEIDFGTGDDGYKAHWMDKAEPLYELRFYNLGRLDGLIGALKAKIRALAGRG